MSIKQYSIRAALFTSAILAGNSAFAATLNVCQSGCTYSLPSQALAAAAAGDTISIGPGTYNDCMYITKNNITVLGTSARPAMTGKVCGQKGIIVTAGQNAVIKNLELYGATDSENYAGIRHDAAGFNLTLDNVYIHDNDDGLLASATGDTILIQNSKFERNGMNAGSGMAHNMYIGRSASFTFKNSQSLRSKLGGHLLKSRARQTIVDSSTIATLDGQDSRNLDISEGGVVKITNSVLEKGPSSENGEMIGFAPEAYDTTISHSFTMTNNLVIEDRGSGPVVDFFHSPSQISITGNTFVGPDAIANAGSPSGNTSYATRTAAGYAAYPWLPAVPTVTASPTPSPTPTVTATVTPKPTVTATPSPTPTVTATPKPTVTATPSPSPTPTTTTLPNSVSYKTGQFTLYAGQKLVLNGGTTLSMRASDGKLIVTNSSGSVLYASRNGAVSCVNAVCKAYFQPDGNLVLMKGTSIYWGTGTGGNRLGTLTFSRTNPYLKITNGSGTTLWVNN
ncbi:MAG: hypothetical protein ACJ763_10125 [Bdellovibrionia bacterium]